MRRLIAYMRPYRWWVALSLVFLLAQSATQVLGPLLTRTAVDRYLQPQPERIPAFLAHYLPTDAHAGIVRIGIAYAAILLANFLLEFVYTVVMQYIGQHAMFDLRRELMAHLQRLDLGFYDRNPVGRLVTRLTTDVDVLTTCSHRA